jgi:hypothetical protein
MAFALSMRVRAHVCVCDARALPTLAKARTLTMRLSAARDDIYAHSSLFESNEITSRTRPPLCDYARSGERVAFGREAAADTLAYLWNVL